MTEKKQRPATLSRKSTPQYVTKAGYGEKRREHRERDEETREKENAGSDGFPAFWYVLLLIPVLVLPRSES